MQAARRSATRSRFSTSRSARTPPFDDNIPPSNRATTDLPETGDRPGSGSVGSFMADVARLKSRKLALLQPAPPAPELVDRPEAGVGQLFLWRALSSRSSFLASASWCISG